MSGQSGLRKSPTVSGGRSVTITLRATRQQVETIDAIARKRGQTRAAFVQDCANLGFRTLKNSGKLA